MEVNVPIEYKDVKRYFEFKPKDTRSYIRELNESFPNNLSDLRLFFKEDRSRIRRYPEIYDLYKFIKSRTRG